MFYLYQTFLHTPFYFYILISTEPHKAFTKWHFKYFQILDLYVNFCDRSEDKMFG